MKRRAKSRRRSRRLALACVVIAALAGLVWLAGRPAARLEEGVSGGGMRPTMVPLGDALAVRGSPGWSALSLEERRRAETPLTEEARAWLESERETVWRVAQAFDVAPVALGGIVAVEKTLLVGRADVLGEDLFRAVFGSLEEGDLERWATEQESAFQREAAASSGAGGWKPVRHPYLWTLGPAQVSFRLAIQYEPAVARRLGRPPRGVAEVLDAVTSMPGNIEYAAALVAEAQSAYRELAGMDISANPGVLATLYQLGSPTVRARRLATENAARAARDAPVQPPQVNVYGAFVNHHAGEIAVLLGVAGRAARGDAPDAHAGTTRQVQD